MFKKLSAIAAVALIGATTFIPSFADSKLSIEDVNTTAQVEPRAQYGEITANNVNLRKTPNGAVIRQLHKGYKVTVSYDAPISAGGYKWQKVTYYQGSTGYTGYVATKYLLEYGG